MRKKEDLKKHLSGEKSALKADSRINIFFLFFLILPGIIFPQIPVNGFCILNSFKIPAEYQRAVSADLDADLKDEIILFSSNLKKLGILSVAEGKEFTFREHSVEYEFSQIRYLKDLSRFACVSRKNRLIAVYEFTISFPPELISTIGFDSYPENISEGDINNDGKLEILVSGAGFDGLSILFTEKSRLAEKKILTGESFSNAVFTDLTNDGYPDIAAFNIINNKIQFFYNNTRGRFSFEREIKLIDKIDFLSAADIDNDGLQDLLFTRGTDFNILYGDFQSAYTRKKTVPLKFKPDFIRFGRFNSDDIVDIAYVNNSSGSVNILFGGKRRAYFNEITYTILPSLLHLQTFKEKKKENLITLAGDGVINTFSPFNNNLLDINLVPAVNAGSIRKFDWNNDNISDICFIDEYDNSLKILLRDSKGIPSLYYQNQLAESHDKIIVDDFYKQRKTFYCYSGDKQLIESLRFNFRTNKGILQQLYSPGKIKDVSIQRADSSLLYIYVLYEKFNKLHIGRFEHKEQSITFKEFPFVDRNVVSARLFLNKEAGTFYWKESADSVFLNEAKIVNGRIIYRGIVGLGKKDSTRVSLFASNTLGKNNSSFISLIQSADESFLLKFNQFSYSIIRASDENSVIINFKDKQIHFSQTNNGNNERLLIFNPASGTLNELIISRDGKTYRLKGILDSPDINNYFIDKFRNGINHLVYSNKQKGFISVIPLKK